MSYSSKNWIFWLLHWSELKNWLVYKMHPPLCFAPFRGKYKYPYMLLALGCWSLVLLEPSYSTQTNAKTKNPVFRELAGFIFYCLEKGGNVLSKIPIINGLVLRVKVQWCFKFAFAFEFLSFLIRKNCVFSYYSIEFYYFFH